MAQAPATPKARRLALRTRAALGLAAPPSSSPAERAAFGLRASGPPPPPVSPQLRVLIPLVGRHHVGDWAQVTARLTATLNSFLRQTNPNWTLTLCGQDRPDLPDDARIQWLPFDETVTGNDKWAKLRHLTTALSQDPPKSGYAMTFDADDLLAPWVVEHMVQTCAPNGYLVTQGYVWDASTGGLAQARPQSIHSPGQKAFWKLCGSCAAFRCDSAQEAGFLQAATQHEHRMFPYLAALAGRPLRPLPGPAALYIVNHGENFGIRRGRTSFKTRFVTRFPVTRASEQDRIVQAFRLEGPAPTVPNGP